MIRKLILAGVLLLPLALATGMIAGCARTTEAPPAADAAAEPGRTDALLRSYLGLRRLLAEDRYEEVPEQFAEVRKAAQALADSGNAKAEARAVAERAAVKPDNLKEAREAFKGLSAAVIELVKVAPPSDRAAEDLYVAYCPMAKASWLQTSTELANPYMGQEMPRCGEIKETIETRST